MSGSQTASIALSRPDTSDSSLTMNRYALVSIHDVRLLRGSLTSPLYINIGSSLIIVPVSSFVSRIAAVKESSSELMNPPGSAHSPLDRFIKRIFCAIVLIITLSAV